MHTNDPLYKKAFQEYLRNGTPIELYLKQTHPTTHYIWRTRRDGKVRPSHAANNGKIFAWDTPPPTGHPGEDYGCRCTAEPYVVPVANISEQMTITLTGVSDTGREWTDEDFEDHYYEGKGKGVTLRQIGHLVKVVAKYMKDAEERIKGQVADAARKNIGQPFIYNFVNIYDMINVVFSLGDTTIGGGFFGTAILKNDILHVEGTLAFFQRDEFADPLDLGFELPGSVIYPISDRWNGTLSGQVFIDRSRSKYIHS